MKKNLWSKIIILLAFFFLISSISPAQELFKLYESDDNIELKAVNNISSQQLINAIGSGGSIVGEKLDSTDYDPGYVEYMADSIARDLLQRSDLDANLKDGNRQHGIWVVPSGEASYYPHSGKHNVINKWGDTKMGIGFPAIVNIHGAWFAGQGGGKGVWASSIRVIGYRDGEFTQTTDWFEDIDESPTWFAMNLQNVDRIVIEATPVFNGAGWYAIDDFTYTCRITNEQKRSPTIVINFEDSPFNQNLNSSHYSGLTWETGTGNFYREQRDVFIPQQSSYADKEDLLLKERYGSNARGNNPLSTPTLLSDYQGVIRGDATSWSYPPDSCGAAGPHHFVEVVNRNFAVYNKSTGQELINILLGAFLPGSNGDPRVLYDQYSDRWFVTVCDFTTRIYLAVSMSDDPTGSWFKSSFVVSQGSDAGKWPDYPTLGVDEDGIYTAAYMVGGSSKMSIFALDKAPLIAPDPSMGNIYAFRELPWEGAIQPVHTFDTVLGEYFVSRASSTTLRVRLLTGLPSPPVLTEKGFVTVPSNSDPPDAPALGSTTPLDTVDSRLMNAVYRNGAIWTTHCINVDGRAASRWYKINIVNVTLADYGTIQDPVMYYFFPTIMVNTNDDVVMGFSGTCSGQYAAAYYTGRLSSDPTGAMAPPMLLKAGEATYNLIDSYGRNRWGDYSLCSLDPLTQTFWTIQEYAHSHNVTGVNRWGTWIGELSFNRPPETPEIFGPNEGTIRVEYTFTAVTSDPDGDQIFYMFDWGDGNMSSWLGLYPSNETATTTYTWLSAGSYNVRVKAKDSKGTESNWSTAHTIVITAGPIIEIGAITGGIGKVKAVIMNTGVAAATNVSWKIDLTNGLIILGRETTGTIATLNAGGEQTVASKFIFGFGKTVVKVTADTTTKSVNATVLLFYIKIS